MENSLQKLRVWGGWGALTCSSLLLIYGRFELIRDIAAKGINSVWGSAGNLFIPVIIDSLLIPSALVLFIFSRLLLKRWEVRFLWLNAGILLTAIVSYAAAFSSEWNIRECGNPYCGDFPFLKVLEFLS